MAENYQSAKTAFEEHPEIATKVYTTAATILDEGDCVEIRKNKDGTPKVLRVRRENT